METGTIQAILWKHYVIRKRHYILTILEVCTPICLIALLAYARSQIPGFNKEVVNTTTFSNPITDDTLRNRITISDIKIYYTPNTNFTSDLIWRTQQKLNIYNNDVLAFDTELDLFKYYNENASAGTNVAIVFSNVGRNTPKHLDYTMKIYKDSVLWQTNKRFVDYTFYIPGLGSENYIQESFLPIQYALETSFIEVVTNKDLHTKFVFEEYPYPPHISDSGMDNAFLSGLPTVIVISFLFVCSTVLKNVVEEKSSGIKELMKINGLKRTALWFGWFVNGFLLNVLSVSVIVFFLKYQLWGVEYPPIEHCHWFILWLLLALYCSATISFMLAFSTLFNRATLAMVMGNLIWFACFIIFSSISAIVLELNPGIQSLLALMPTVSLFYGFTVISKFELRQVNLDFSRLFEKPSGGVEEFYMGSILLFLFCETAIFFLLTLYMDNIFPGPYGVPKPWHFIFSEYDCIQRKLRRCNSISHTLEGQPDLGDTIEKLQVSDSDVVIRITDLTKVYPDSKVKAVNKLNMDIYKGTVTGLLGHNGAGKTTTMSMITGVTAPTCGDILIDGVSITSDPDRARATVSICPQHNLLFNELTVREHLLFFGLLRGMDWKSCKQAANVLMREKLCLGNKENSLINELSGGMKRKLSLGIALMGNPKVVILDEPTAGIDVEGRREIWNLILSYRVVKTILISTHFLEEADALSDRIAIMDNGNLVCYGSSIFLRNKYDMGYVCTINYSNPENMAKIKQFVEDHITDHTNGKTTDDQVVCQNYTADMLKLCLPNSKKDRFSALFHDMQKNKEIYSISNITMSNTTLEDIVLKVMSGLQSEKTENHADLPLMEASKSHPSTAYKFQKLVSEHWRYYRKMWKQHLFMIILFFLCGFITLYLNKVGYESVSQDGTKLPLKLDAYGETKVYYSVKGSDNEQIRQYYANIVQASHSVPIIVNDTVSAIIQIGIENFAQYKKRMVIATEFQLAENEVEHVKVLYSTNALHGAPISLNVATNVILKYLMGEDYAISATNTPLHTSKHSYVKVQQSESSNLLLWVLLLPLGPLFFCCNLLAFPTCMRVNNITVLQKLCGVTTKLYWFKNYCIDFIFYTIGTLLVVLILWFLIWANIFQMDAHLPWPLFLILILYGASNIPFAYLFTQMKSTEAATLRFLTISLTCGITFATVLIIVESFASLKYWLRLTQFLVLLVPQSTLTYLLGKFAIKTVQVHNWDIRTPDEVRYLCYENPTPCCVPDSAECLDWRNPFAYSSILVCCELCIAFFYFIVVIYMNSGYGVLELFEKLLRVTYKREKAPKDQTDNTGSNNRNGNKDTFSVTSLSKSYFNGLGILPLFKWLNPVVNVTFEVKEKECLGLLGVNGAGKTTTFRMLTSEVVQTSGTISKNHDKLNMGYCPQGDSLIDHMIASEYLRMFAKLRYKDGNAPNIDALLKNLGLDDTIPCGKLSGGNKRKLNIALAILMCPSLLLLDEPTTGVDPLTRRELWRIIQAMKNSERNPSSVILTSHSMEECEALCDRISIMKRGKIVATGTVAELKEKYCVGHIVEIKFNNDEVLKENADKVMEELRQKIHDGGSSSVHDTSVIERERLSNGLKVQIVNSGWAEIFNVMGQLTGFGISDYYVRETSFEEVFLKIAAEIDEAAEIDDDTQGNLRHINGVLV